MQGHFPDIIRSFCVLSHEKGMENAQVTLFFIEGHLQVLRRFVTLSMEDAFWVIKCTILVAPFEKLIFF
jgi:hypothetical protein